MGGVLHHNKDCGLVFNNLIHLSNGGMLGDFEDMKLPWYSLNICYIFDFILLEYFDGDRFSSYAVKP